MRDHLRRFDKAESRWRKVRYQWMVDSMKAVREMEICRQEMDEVLMELRYKQKTLEESLKLEEAK